MRWKQISNSNYIISENGIILHIWGISKHSNTIKVCGRERGVFALMKLAFGKNIPKEEVWANIENEVPNHWISSNKQIGREVAQSINNGYLRCSLRINNKQYRRFVHRLVLEAFIGPCPIGMECCHLDDNPMNNNLENLKWGTHQENMNNRDYKGEKNPSSKLTEDQIKEIRKHAENKNPIIEISKHFGVSKKKVRSIITGHAWSHVEGYIAPSVSKWDKEDRLGKMSDEELSKILNLKISTIRSARLQRGIPSYIPILENDKIKTNYLDRGITPNDGEEINCIDIDKLKYSSRKVNNIRKGEAKPNAKFTENDIRKIRILSSSMSYGDLAKLYETTARYIAKIARKEKWKHVD